MNNRENINDKIDKVQLRRETLRRILDDPVTSKDLKESANRELPEVEEELNDLFDEME